MNIRSITAFANLTFPLDEGQILTIGEKLQTAKRTLEEAGLTVQTTRLASQPLAAILDDPQKSVVYAKAVEVAAHGTGIDYVSLGPVRLADDPTFAEALPAVFTACDNVFASVEGATPGGGIDPARLRMAARLIRRVSGIDPNGFTNLMMAVLANVGPWSPFFPAAYHGGGELCMAVATEAADLAVEAISSAGTLAEAREGLTARISAHAEQLHTAFDALDIPFRGIDFSLAPFPSDERSIGYALEGLGLQALGGAGSLAAAAWLTDTIDRVAFKRVGFSGLMLPVLEDSGLATRAAEGAFTVRDLLMFSAVCGTGLDTIPLPGEVSEGALFGLLLDVAALALRLDKPLTARLMPIPGKAAGEPTGFDFEFFANSRVMALPQDTVRAPLNGQERIPIGARSV
jgi:hypothetical protein